VIPSYSYNYGGCQEHVCNQYSLPCSRLHLSNDDCLEYKRENYQNCFNLDYFVLVLLGLVSSDYVKRLARKNVSKITHFLSSGA